MVRLFSFNEWVFIVCAMLAVGCSGSVADDGAGGSAGTAGVGGFGGAGGSGGTGGAAGSGGTGGASGTGGTGTQPVNAVWAETFLAEADTSFYTPSDLCRLPNGDIVMVGDAETEVDLGGGPLAIPGDLNVGYLGWFDSDGQLKTSLSLGETTGVRCAVDGDEILIAFTTNRAVDYGNGAQALAFTDVHAVTRLDATGSEVESAYFEVDGSTGAIAPDGAGGVLLAGDFNSVAVFEQSLAGGSGQPYFARLDADLAPVYSHAVGTSQARALAVGTDGAGGAVFVGRGAGGEVDVLAPATVDLGLAERSLFVVRVDSAGGYLAGNAFAIDSDSPIWGYEADINGIGNVVVAGRFSGPVNFGGTELSGAGGFFFAGPIFVVGFDRDATHRFSVEFDWNQNSGNGAILDDVRIDDRDGVVFVVQAGGSPDFGGGPLEAPAAGRALYVARLNNIGEHTYSEGYGNDYQPDPGAIAQTPSGGLIVAGIIYEPVTFGGIPLVPHDGPGEYSLLLSQFEDLCAAPLEWNHDGTCIP